MVSVIIPIYNVCKFIEHGLQQILCQSYKDFEILLVDDGSNDDSYEECKKWELKDKRIRVLHQENQGAGIARNLGIDNAKGNYVYFFDIDDEISNNLLEYNIDIMTKKNVDMIVFGYQNIETTYNSQTTITFTETEIHNNSQLRDIYIDEFVMKENGFPWNKFYSKDFLDRNNIRFEDQRIQQDEVFNLLCYRHLQKLYISPKILYKYYVYEKGNTRSRFIPDRFDIYKSVRQHFEQIRNYWNLTDKRFDNYLNSRFYFSVLQCINFNIFHQDCPWTKEEKISEIKRILNNPYTKESLKYAKSNIKSVEHRLYIKAINNMSLWQIKFYTSIFNLLHQIRKKIK